MMTVGSQPSSESRERRFLATDDWARALAERTAGVDAAVAAAAAAQLFPAVPQGVALVAVGGYGRRELFPHSDIDLLLLFSSERLAEESRDAIARLLQTLWDAGMRVSQSVRTPEECGRIHDRNAELNVSLLDHRYLAGDRTLYAAMAERVSGLLRSRRGDLARHLARLTRERHARFNNTYYYLEPDIKSTPGAMRDLQFTRWLDRLRSQEMPEAEELRAARAFMARVRVWLHCRAGRDDNRLTFEAQEEAAERWAAGDAAAWMREYFRHARTADRAARAALDIADSYAGGLFTQFQQWRQRLSNTDFSVSRDRVHLREPRALETDPGLLLRLAEFVARHGITLSADAAHRVREHLPVLTKYFAEPRPVWAALSRVFSLPHAPEALRELHETGALQAIFPEFADIACLVVRDFYHRYTVDEHSLVAVRNLFSLHSATDESAAPYAPLFKGMETPAPLVFALLFHDIGKGRTPGRHVEGSLSAADSAMARVEMPAQVRKTVRFLIRQHLAMPAMMRSRDPADPATALEIAHLAGTVEDLRALTLASWADLSAVAPGVMSAWRAAQLWRLYLAGYRELTSELSEERIDAVREVAGAFLAGFPTRYLRTRDAREMEQHLRLEEASRATGVATALEHAGDVWRLTLVARDRPGLFASAAGALAGWGMNIVKAEAFGNAAGTILDTFTFADPLRTLELNPMEVDRLRATVERVVSGKLSVHELLRNRPRPAAPSRKSTVAPSVTVGPDAPSRATLIEIVAQDRPGLLHDLASAVSSQGCDIEVVLVDTEAHRAIDVFYVTFGGRPLDGALRLRVAAALEAVCAQS